MTDPIGTAQERELIERVRELSARGLPHDVRTLGPAIADALLSRIAEVERLREALDPFARIVAINEQLALDWPDDKPARDVLPGAWPTWGDLKRARAALSQH